MNNPTQQEEWKKIREQSNKNFRELIENVCKCEKDPGDKHFVDCDITIFLSYKKQWEFCTRKEAIEEVLKMLPGEKNNKNEPYNGEIKSALEPYNDPAYTRYAGTLWGWNTYRRVIIEELNKLR